MTDLHRIIRKIEDIRMATEDIEDDLPLLEELQNQATAFEDALIKLYAIITGRVVEASEILELVEATEISRVATTATNIYSAFAMGWIAGKQKGLKTVFDAELDCVLRRFAKTHENKMEEDSTPSS